MLKNIERQIMMTTMASLTTIVLIWFTLLF